MILHEQMSQLYDLQVHRRREQARKYAAPQTPKLSASEFGLVNGKEALYRAKCTSCDTGRPQKSMYADRTSVEKAQGIDS